MANRKPRSISPTPTPRREYWRALVEEHRRSGLSLAEFCRQRGIPRGSLSCWKHKLSRERKPGTAAAPSPPGRPVFVPVRIAPPRLPALAADPKGPVRGDGALDIVLGRGRLVRVRGPVDVQWLGRVVQALEAGGC
jgi:hypothetical protein